MVIVRTKDISFGRPRLNGTRLEVFNIVSDLFNTSDVSHYLEEYNISYNDAIEIVNYCKTLKCQEINEPFEKYCSGCVLSTLHENFNYKQIELQELTKELFKDKNRPNFIAIGKKSEIEDELYGKPGWILANEITFIK